MKVWYVLAFGDAQSGKWQPGENWKLSISATVHSQTFELWESVQQYLKPGKVWLRSRLAEHTPWYLVARSSAINTRKIFWVYIVTC